MRLDQNAPNGGGVTEEPIGTQLPLSGVQVVELDRGFAQYAGKLLASLGARVVKVESPRDNPLRHAAPFYDGIDDGEHSIPFWHYNACKESVVLDLDDQEHMNVLHRLISRSDILLDGLGGHGAANLGLTSDVLAELSPGIIHTVITPFGMKGPWREFQTSDLVSMALGGVAGQTGYDSVDGEPGQPIAPVGGQSLHFAGIIAATASVSALQEDVGIGVRTIDIAIHDAIAVSTEIPVPMWEFGQAEVYRHTGRHAAAAQDTPAWQFRCKDGSYVCALTLYLNDRRFSSLIDLFDTGNFSHDLRDDRFRTQKQRDAIMPLIVDAIAEFCKLQTADYVFLEAQRRSLPWAKVRSVEEIAADEHLHERGFFTPVEQLPGVIVDLPGLPWQGMPTALNNPNGPTARIRAPRLGEDTLDALNELERDLVPLYGTPLEPQAAGGDVREGKGQQ